MAGLSRANKRLDEAVDLYLQRIANEGQSAASVKTARYALSRFRKAVAARQPRKPNPYVHEIDAGLMDDYCYGPDGIRRGISAISFNRYRSALMSFFNYALVMRWTDQNPMDAISRARPDKPRQRLMLNAGELITLLEMCDNPVHRVACAIGMNTGLRANDIRHLTIFDASLASGEIQTEIRKTRKLDVKPITADLHRELVRWFDTYAQLMDLPSRAELPSEWLLVPSYRVMTWTPKVYNLRPTQVHQHPWVMVKAPLAKMGYPTKQEGFHTLRRSSARVFFELLRDSGEGRDHALMTVKEYLNHSSVSMTEHYLGLNHERTIRDAQLKDKSFLTRAAEMEQARAGETNPTGLRHLHGS